MSWSFLYYDNLVHYFIRHLFTILELLKNINVSLIEVLRQHM